jgi:hypothetical protein
LWGGLGVVYISPTPAGLGRGGGDALDSALAVPGVAGCGDARTLLSRNDRDR